MIGNIGVMGAPQTGRGLDREGGGGEIHGPENHSGCVKVHTPGGKDAADFGAVAGKVVARVWDAPAEDHGAASRAAHVVEAGAGVKVMTAAGASSYGGTSTVAAVGENVATGSDDEARVHRDLRRVNRSE